MFSFHNYNQSNSTFLNNELLEIHLIDYSIPNCRDRTVVGLITTYALSAYHH